MNEFREWLSDNLRYFVLGLGIILIIVVVVFGVRFAFRVASNKDNQGNKTEASSGKELPEENTKLQEESQNLDEDSQNKADTTGQAGTTQVTTMLQEYYNALSKKDVTAVKSFVDTLELTDERSILNVQYIEGYEDIKILIKPITADEAYVGFVSYNMKLQNISTAYPTFSQNYVKKNDTGSWYVVGTALTDEEQEKVSQLGQDPEVVALKQSITEKAEEMKEQDPALKSFITELGVANSKSLKAEVGAQIKTISGCKLRKEPNTEAESLATLESGEIVEKVGVSDDWVVVKYNDLQGYIRADLLE